VSRLEGQGHVLIKGSAFGKNEAIEQRIHNVARLAATTQPQRRIVSIDNRDGSLEVLTTLQKLAHRLAHELKKAFGGRVASSWSDDGTLVAEWDWKGARTTSRRERGQSNLTD
jgi:hypothetical protein